MTVAEIQRTLIARGYGLGKGGADGDAGAKTRVVGIEGGLQSVACAIQGLSEKLDRRSATPWSVIWSAAGVCFTVLLGVGTLAYRPIEAGQTRHEHDGRETRSGIVSCAEHEGRWRQDDRNFDFMRDRVSRIQGRIDKRIERLEERIFGKP